MRTVDISWNDNFGSKHFRLLSPATLAPRVVVSGADDVMG